MLTVIKSLTDPRLARGRVKTCGDQIPVACEQGYLRADELTAPAISHEQGKSTRVVEDERIALPSRLLPAVSEMLFDLGAGLAQRRPDVAYVSYERWPRQRRVPRTRAWTVVPEMAVGVISPSNTFEEVVNKVHEYFRVGVQHVWVVAPPQQQVYVYQSPSHIRVLNVQDELTGDLFLPGLRLKLSELFELEVTEA
jgi:Uma2 family endonuclease